MTVAQRPRYPLDDAPERRRYEHLLEWSGDGSWEYTSTWFAEADLQDDWDPTQPEGWELNTDRWPWFDEERAGWTRLGPGVLRNPNPPSGPMVIVHWRRRKPGLS